jgi:hypothetical protein
MPQGRTAPGITATGEVTVESDGKLIYHSSSDLLHQGSYFQRRYERHRVGYCFLMRGKEIPPYYRTGAPPPHGYMTASILLEMKILRRRLTKWLKEHHR